MRCIKHTVYMPFNMPRSWNLDDVEDKPLTALTRAAEALACLLYLGKWLKECHPVSLTCEHGRENICCAGRKAYMYIRPGESQSYIASQIDETPLLVSKIVILFDLLRSCCISSHIRSMRTSRMNQTYVSKGTPGSGNWRGSQGVHSAKKVNRSIQDLYAQEFPRQ